MNEKEKTALDAATSKSGDENKTFIESIVSNSDFITAVGTGQGRIESLLLHGSANAIRTADLVKLGGFRSVREMQKQIERERVHGALILSRGGAGGGYFLPAEGEQGQREISSFVRTLDARARNTFRTIKAARAALQVLPGQMEVENKNVEQCEKVFCPLS